MPFGFDIFAQAEILTLPAEIPVLGERHGDLVPRRFLRVLSLQ